MDAGDVAAAAGGFWMGQMFAGQSQAKPALFHFVALRFNRNFDVMPLVKEVIREIFFEPVSNPKADLELEFTGKAELKVFNKPKKWGQDPLLTFPMCYWYASRVDLFFCIALRNEISSPMPQNISLLRNLLIKLKANKVEYEIW